MHSIAIIFISASSPSTMRHQQDFSKSSCSCYCPPLQSCSFLVPLGIPSYYPSTSLAVFLCFLFPPLILVALLPVVYIALYHRYVSEPLQHSFEILSVNVISCPRTFLVSSFRILSLLDLPSKHILISQFISATNISSIICLVTLQFFLHVALTSHDAMS